MQHLGNIAVIVGDADRSVRDEKNDIRLLDSYLDLGTDFILIRLIFQLNAAGIDHMKFLVEPGPGSVDPVTGDARLIFDNGQPAADAPVENRRFAYIRSSDNCYC